MWNAVEVQSTTIQNFHHHLNMWCSRCWWEVACREDSRVTECPCLPWDFTGETSKQQKGSLKVPSLPSHKRGTFISQRGTALLLTAQGRDCSLLQWPYLKSVAALNHTSKHPTRTTGVFLWALHWTTTTPVSHQAESIFTGEVSKPLHHPARAHSRRQANNIRLLQSVT